MADRGAARPAEQGSTADVDEKQLLEALEPSDEHADDVAGLRTMRRGSRLP